MCLFNTAAYIGIDGNHFFILAPWSNGPGVYRNATGSPNRRASLLSLTRMNKWRTMLAFISLTPKREITCRIPLALIPE